jgi:transcription antitermination factor NusG
MLDAATQPRIHTPQRDTGPADVSAPKPSGNRWHVVYTHPQAERRATQHLAEQGYTAYLPMIVARRRDNVIRSLFHHVPVPLFPRYAFVQFDAMRDPWMPIMHTLGVRSLLCRPDGTPDPCRAGAVEAVRASEDARRHLPAGNGQLAPGVAVSVRKGHMAEMPAIVLSVGQDEARIAVMFLAQLRELTVPLGAIIRREDD